MSGPSKQRQAVLSVLLPFVLQYASHVYCNAPPICIAELRGHLGGCGHQDGPQYGCKGAVTTCLSIVL